MRTFATTGHAPDAAGLWGATPAGHELSVLLAELHDRDVIRLDDRGRIRAAYPFSGVPTVHVVTIDGGPTVFAMCAIDALGMSAMLGRAVQITSADPAIGDRIEVAVDGVRAHWRPDTAVVFVGADTPATVGDGSPPAAGQPGLLPAADRCCGMMNFFTGLESATAWSAAHPTVSGSILTQEQALRLGIDIFGQLLDD
jgi:hypothetical protein